jgi:D-amino peptidase
MSKFYLMTDLEGVAGVYDWEERGEAGRGETDLVVFEQRMRQRRWLAREVSAAIEGFASGGADEIIVNDGHGAGYTIDLDELQPNLDEFFELEFADDDDDGMPILTPEPIVNVINGLERPFWLPYLDESCAATGIVGAHPKAQTFGGCLYHTMWLGVRDYSLNGISVGEMGLQAAIAGHFNVPFVFCSGDAYACREIEELIPGCVTVPVKTGLSRKSAMTLTPAEAQAAIREGAEEAMERIGQVKPFKLDTPILFREERMNPDFDAENPPPHSRVIDAHTREIETADILDLMCILYGYPRDWKPLSR